MKKSKFNFIRAGALTMVLAMGTTCFMSGTLAKYVTSGTGGDTARVAKFGVTVTAEGQTFAQSYDAEATVKTVVSSDDSKLVAPGTKGNMSAIAVTGTPEVAVQLDYTVNTFDIGDKWVDANGEFYCPLIITVGADTFDGKAYTTADAFETDVINAITEYSNRYEANTDLSGASVPSVSWEWPFFISDANDVKDTYLGDQAAKGNAATVTLEMTVTVTQID